LQASIKRKVVENRGPRAQQLLDGGDGGRAAAEDLAGKPATASASSTYIL